MARPKGIDRPYRLNVKLSEEEHGLAEQLAARVPLDVSAYLRSLIVREAEKHLGWTPAKSVLFRGRLKNDELRAAVEAQSRMGASVDAIEVFVASVEKARTAKR